MDGQLPAPKIPSGSDVTMTPTDEIGGGSAKAVSALNPLASAGQISPPTNDAWGMSGSSGSGSGKVKK